MRIAVIGGGPSGLVSLKSLKEEDDYFDPVCFEATDDHGGTWKFREEDVQGVASVMRTTVINHSKELGALSDFPPPSEYPNYMPHYLAHKYWSDYGKANDCLRHIKYNHEVIKVKMADDYDSTGGWIVDVKNKDTGKIISDTFDGVLVGVGHSTHPHIPKLKGMEKFKGKVVHSHSLKKMDELKDQRVAVIGIGCSGLDASVETSAVANKVFLSTRSGAWIFPRMGPYGTPFDYTLLRRWLSLFLHYLPTDLVSSYIEHLMLNRKFSHTLYGIKPKHHVLSQNPAVSDIFPYKLLIGSILLKGDVKTFTENGIIFDGEDEETPLDTVIMATGYKWGFPFLDDGIVVTEGKKINLYKCIFPPHLKHPSLAVIGFVQPLGPGFPFGELQSRWYVQLMLDNLKLPSETEMRATIDKYHNQMLKRYPNSDRVTIQVDFIAYLDDMASQIGAKPNYLKMAFTDPKLFWTLCFGPSLTYQYRLQGPHSWDQARQAILTSNERMKTPLQKRKHVKFCDTKPSNFMYYVSLLAVLWTIGMMLLGYMSKWSQNYFDIFIDEYLF